jgi:release factor glutamine methyltransferase
LAPPEVWTVQRILRWTKEHFERKGLDSPRLTGELLLAHALGTTRLKLYMEHERPLEAAELERYRALVRRRAEGVPTQYLVGGREFYGRWFNLDSRAFIPRQETELLVEACLAAIPVDGADFRALDLCAGSGCVGVTLLAERPALRVTAVELSAETSEVALGNATSLGVQERYQLLQGDLFGPLDPAAQWPLIVSNPPYVATGDIAGLQVEVRDHEPRLALDGGPEGLDVIRRIVSESANRLAPGGQLALEIGDDQGPAVRALLEAAGLREVAVTKDYAGNDRIALARC